MRTHRRVRLGGNTKSKVVTAVVVLLSAAIPAERVHGQQRTLSNEAATVLGGEWSGTIQGQTVSQDILWRFERLATGAVDREVDGRHAGTLLLGILQPVPRPTEREGHRTCAAAETGGSEQSGRPCFERDGRG